MVTVTDHFSLFFVAVLSEQMKEAEGSSTDYEKEIEELKELLPEIREKIEDAKESQRSGNVAELALKATLVGLVSFKVLIIACSILLEGIMVSCSISLGTVIRFSGSWWLEGM